MNNSVLLRSQLKPELQPKSGDSDKVQAVELPKGLRDEFAMAALEHANLVYGKMTVGELDRMMGRKSYSKDEAVARLAYNMADAMLVARQV